MVGIEEVAKLAGVSTATVSRALSGKDHVSPKTRDKVLAVANELNYVASSSAFTLATGRTRNIGVVLPYVDRWFFSVILESIEQVLIEHGYDLTLYNLSGGASQREKIFSEFLRRKRVDGVLTVAVKLSEAERDHLTKTLKPIIGIGGPIAGVRTLSIDDVDAGRKATQHLITLGHTRIALIGGGPKSEMDFHQPTLRRQGYIDALKQAGIEPPDEWTVESDFTMEDAYRATKQILGDPQHSPTAIVCASDEMAFGAIMATKDLGLRVPQDISIIGIDNHDLADFYGLTTISQEPRKQGERAALKMLELLDGSHTGELVNIESNDTFPIELMVRSSTARATR